MQKQTVEDLPRIAVEPCVFSRESVGPWHCDAGSTAAWLTLVGSALLLAVLLALSPTNCSWLVALVPSSSVPAGRRGSLRRQTSDACGRKTGGSVVSGKSAGAGNASRELRNGPYPVPLWPGESSFLPTNAQKPHGAATATRYHAPLVHGWIGSISPRWSRRCVLRASSADAPADHGRPFARTSPISPPRLRDRAACL
jgi:hypothetical protein